jgi:tetratricopeptide (TPR) repeat protein
MALHLDEGTVELVQEIKDNPYNLMSTYLADYHDCLLLLFNGDKTDYEQRKGHMDSRLSILDRGDSRSPWFLLCKAGIYLHWAFVNIRMGENLKAANYFRKSFQLLKENRKRFPSFEYNDIFWGLETAAVGAIPDDYKWIASIFGMRGDVKKGLNYLSSFINTHTAQDPLRNEAVIYYAYFRFYLLSQHKEVWNFVNSSQFPVSNNLLHLFVRTNIAVNYRKADVAIQTLKLAQEDAGYNRYPIFDYELGTALLLKLNLNCITTFQRFLSRYRGNFFVKDTWQKIAYAYYIQGNMREAESSKEKIKTEGTTSVDADKQALRFAKNGKWPDKTLLEVRLLVDGGYAKQALERISVVKESSLDMPGKLEYNFRMGRIYDELGNESKALQYYQVTINMGRDRQEHFAARSALQMAFIYEQQGKINEALSKYKECTGMQDHDFKNSIDQQAKAGINRLTVKD